MTADATSRIQHTSPPVDVVVVTYNSGPVLREAVGSLAGAEDLHVIVVDNASPTDSLSSIADLPVEMLRLPHNGGFAYGCNRGWLAGHAPYVLFLNPDARIDADAIRKLVAVLEGDDRIGIAAPLIRDEDGTIDYSLRRFPRLRSTYAQALFLQRLFPQANWSDEVVRDLDAYTRRRSADWVSGACLLVRRDLLERLDGWDEGFFLYCEDIDLCRRTRNAGLDVVFEPAAVATHTGGHSGSRPSFFPTLAESRIRYARKHRAPLDRALERVGIGLAAFTHVLVSKGGLPPRVGHARSLAAVVGLPVTRP